MKQKILEYYTQNPRGFTRSIQKDTSLNEDILKFKLDHNIETTNFSELAYRYLHNITSLACQFGNQKKFRSFSEGYESCKKNCDCSRLIKSQKVSESKAKYTPEQNQEINEKRKQTSLEKYGVTNNGQTENAKKKFREFYDNRDNVKNQQLKQEETMQKRYGVRNALQLSHAREKMIIAINQPEIKQKSKETRIQNHNPRKIYEINYQRIMEIINQEHNVSCLTSIHEYKGVSDVYYKFKCNACEYEFETWIDNGHRPICKICYPTETSYVSNEERQVADFVENLGIQIVRGDRTIINPYQIDILIPSHKLAIEYGGLYWHSEYSSGKAKDYHKKKMELCNDKGYELITIFSDEWNQKQDICKRILSHRFGISNQTIYARNCQIIEVSKTDQKLFFNEMHLQSHVGSTIAYGLVYNNELVGCISFGENRAIFNRENNGWEIRRLAFKYNIPGGASRVFEHFINEQKPYVVYSDCDLRWSSGKIYETLGMILHSQSGPNYSYVENYLRRHHRLNFTKVRLIKEGYDITKSGETIMKERGFDRIWDCGIKRFVWRAQ